MTPGTRLGPYEILSLVGSGGMGEVYRARDTRLDRFVALKVVSGPAVTDDADAFQRFSIEARAASALNHPNIVAIFDVGTHEGVPYLVAELLDGESLGARLARGPLPPQKALEFATQIAAGLAAAHAKGIVHRDLKPDNVFITRDNRIKILDFGLAKLVEAPASAPAGGDADTILRSAPLTRVGIIVGTAAYMAPEQIRGGVADTRSDIFAFGAVLFEMLSGQRAFQGPSTVETMHATLTEEPPDIPAAAEHRLAGALDPIVRHCLEKDPEARFQSARDLLFQLTSAASSSGFLAVPAQKRSGSPARVWTIAAVLAIAGTAAGFVIGMRSVRIDLPSYRQLTFRRGWVESARFSPDGQTIVYGGAWDDRRLQMFSTRPENSESHPLGLPDGDILSISSAGEMAISLGRSFLPSRVSHGTVARVPIVGGAPREVLTDVDEADWSPDGKNLAIVHVVGGKYRLEYPIGTVLYEHDGWISHPRLSPAGDLIAFADHPLPGDDRGTVTVIDVKGVRRLTTKPWASVNGVAWAPKSGEVWFTASDVGPNCQLFALDPSGRERLIARAAGRLALQDISRDGRVLVTHGRLRFGMGYRESRSAPERDLSWLDASVAAGLSGDGKTVLFNEQGTGGGSRSYAVYKRGVDGSPAVKLGEGDVTALSADARWAASVLLGPPPSLTITPTSAGQPIVMARGPINDYQAVAWFGDGKRLAFGGREPGHLARIYVQDIPAGSPRAVSAEGVKMIPFSNAVSPDGQWIAAVDAQGAVVRVDVNSGKAAAVASEPNEVPMRWSEDGRALFVYSKNQLPLKIHRLDIASGKRELLAEILPADPAGIRNIIAAQATGDGRSYVYTYVQNLSELYLVENVR